MACLAGEFGMADIEIEPRWARVKRGFLRPFERSDEGNRNSFVNQNPSIRDCPGEIADRRLPDNKGRFAPPCQ